MFLHFFALIIFFFAAFTESEKVDYLSGIIKLQKAYTLLTYVIKTYYEVSSDHLLPYIGTFGKFIAADRNQNEVEFETMKNQIDMDSYLDEIKNIITLNTEQFESSKKEEYSTINL